jgi:hypothetical protein
MFFYYEKYFIILIINNTIYIVIWFIKLHYYSLKLLFLSYLANEQGCVENGGRLRIRAR